MKTKSIKNLKRTGMGLIILGMFTLASVAANAQCPGACTPGSEEADIVLTKTANVTSVSVGDPVDFTITVENKGPCILQSIYVKDIIDQGKLGCGTITCSAKVIAGTATSVSCGYGLIDCGNNDEACLFVDDLSVGGIVEWTIFGAVVCPGISCNDNVTDCIDIVSSTPSDCDITPDNDCVTIGLTALGITITGTDPSCSGICDGSADLTVTSGQPPFTYLWSTGATTEDITGLCAGIYAVTVTDDNSCTATGSVTLNPPALDATIELSQILPRCRCGTGKGTNCPIPDIFRDAICYQDVVTFFNTDPNATNWDWEIEKQSPPFEVITKSGPDNFISVCFPPAFECYEVSLTISGGVCPIAGNTVLADVVQCCSLCPADAPQICSPPSFSTCKWGGQGDNNNNVNEQYTQIREPIGEKSPNTFFIQNYPNPSTDEIRFVYDIPSSGNATMEIYDIKGKRITVLADNVYYEAGNYETVWKTSDVQAGVYFYKFTSQDQSGKGKIMVIR